MDSAALLSPDVLLLLPSSSHVASLPVPEPNATTTGSSKKDETDEFTEEFCVLLSAMRGVRGAVDAALVAVPALIERRQLDRNPRALEATAGAAVGVSELFTVAVPDVGGVEGSEKAL